MTLIAKTQEPEVKVRLAMIGEFCGEECIMLRSVREYGDTHQQCALYPERIALMEFGPHLKRSPACIEAHGGAE